ncbi:MAG TPA: hypothetical protein VK121_02510 [Pseudogracilibacillus sp.]|nr:hypothetical protein [Pseudogracilibacillus sp.]
MKRFCKECGHEASPEDKICVECGTPLDDVPVESSKADETVQQEPKAPMPKKKRMLLYSVIGLLVIVIGFSVWATKYQSEESVLDRFNDAFDDEDEGKLANLMIHEDGESLDKSEVNAFLELSSGDIDDLFSVEENGKFLGIFTKRQVQVVDQYAVYNDKVKGLDFQFNEKEPNVHKTEKDRVIYGPLAPGVYDVAAEFKGKYGETSDDEAIELVDASGDETLMDMIVPVGEVVFTVNNVDEFDAKDAYIQLNKEKIEINDDGETEAVGPMILDKSQKVQTVVKMPWGEVKSAEIPIDSSEMDIQADLISEDQYKDLKTLLKDYGNQYAEALAKKDEKVLKNISKDAIKSNLPVLGDDKFFTGEFLKARINRDDMDVELDGEELLVGIDVGFVYNSDHHSKDEEPNLKKTEIGKHVDLSYDTKKKKWKIEEMKSIISYGDDSFTDEVKGNGKKFKPSKKTIEKASAESVKEEITTFIDDYTEASVDAINENDFSEVSSYIDSSGPRYKEAKEYIDYLYEKDITETWLDSEVEKIEADGDKKWKVTVKEKFELHKPDKDETQTYRTKMVVKEIGGSYKVYELIETNPI